MVQMPPSGLMAARKADFLGAMIGQRDPTKIALRQIFLRLPKQNMDLGTSHPLRRCVRPGTTT